MKKATFILGLIGGILGILIGIVLVVIGLDSKVTDAFGTQAILWGAVAAISSIIGLIGGCIHQKIMLLVAFILNLITTFNLLSNSPTGLYFVIEVFATLLFLVATILVFLNKNEFKELN